MMGEVKASLIFSNIYYILELVSVFIGIQEVIFLHKKLIILTFFLLHKTFE